MDISFVICHFSIYAFKMFGFFILISFVVVVVYSIKKGPGATTVTAVIYCRPSGIAGDIVRATWRFFLIQFSPDPTSAGCCNSSRSLSLSLDLLNSLSPQLLKNQPRAADYPCLPSRWREEREHQ